MCGFGAGGTGYTVISIPSSARMRAAYVTANSDKAWKRKNKRVSTPQGFASRDIRISCGRTIWMRCRECDVDATHVGGENRARNCGLGELYMCPADRVSPEVSLLRNCCVIYCDLSTAMWRNS